MPIFKEPAVGRFGWVELQTKDPAAAKKFYGELLGWTFEDMPSPDPSMSYAMAKVGDASVAGVTSWSPEAAKSGAPPAWVSYVNVKDVQATVDAATKLGGKVTVPPTPMGPGTFAALQDPTGGTFLLWYSPRPMGDFLYGDPGALTWNELLSTNVDVAQRFYTQLFGWKAEAMPMPNMVYTVLKLGEAPIGGIMAQPPDLKGAPSMWAVYFAVDDADATWAKATKLGAKVLMPLTEVPEVGRFGWLQDPQGAAFAIIKNANPMPV